MTNYNKAFKFPFIASEILSNTNEKITSKLIEINNKSQKTYIYDLLLILIKDNISSTTIPGYINKIIDNHLKSSAEIFKSLYLIIDSIYPVFINNIENFLYRQILLTLFSKGISNEEESIRKKFICLYESLFHLFWDYYHNPNKNDKLQGIIYLIISIWSENEDIIKITIENGILDKLFNLFELDNQLYIQNKKILLELFSNFSTFLINDSPKNIYDLNITCLIDDYNTSSYDNSANINNEIKNQNKEIKIISNEIKDLIFNYFSNKIICLYKNTKIIKEKKERSPQAFLFFMDIINCLLFYNLNNSKKDLNFIPEELFLDLFAYLIDFPLNSFLNLKLIKFSELFVKINNLDFKEKIMPFYKNLESYIEKNDLKNAYSGESIKYTKKENSVNAIYLLEIFSILTKFVEDKEVLQMHHKFIKRNLMKDLIENRPENFVKNEDEEIFEIKKDIHDTEAFLFTSKKSIETSKKINAKLKNLVEI